MQLKREPNVDPMFCAKPTDGPFSSLIALSSRLWSFGTKRCAT
jgi:hypothetical protein